jgi:hypothetical protein
MAMPIVGLLLGHAPGHVTGRNADDVAIAVLAVVGAWTVLHQDDHETEALGRLAEGRGVATSSRTPSTMSPTPSTASSAGPMYESHVHLRQPAEPRFVTARHAPPRVARVAYGLQETTAAGPRRKNLQIGDGR